MITEVKFQSHGRIPKSCTVRYNTAKDFKRKTIWGILRVLGFLLSLFSLTLKKSFQSPDDNYIFKLNYPIICLKKR